MPRTGMTTEQIRAKAIDITLAHMRRHGFDRVRLTDVAKDLGLSHAALYAHFADKAALLDTVTEKWLDDTATVLDEVCRADGEPLRKIQDWFLTMYRAKRERILSDPELYRAFDVASAIKKPFVVAHLARMRRQLVDLVKEAGAALGGGEPRRQAGMLFEAMTAFYHPKLMAEHVEENREVLLKQVLRTMLVGMGARR